MQKLKGEINIMKKYKDIVRQNTNIVNASKFIF